MPTDLYILGCNSTSIEWLKEKSCPHPIQECCAPRLAVAELGLFAPGTSDDARLRALGIAAQVLRQAGVTADAAKLAVDKRDAWGDSGMSPLLQPDERDLRAAEAWEDASQAALMSCYRGRTIPLDAELYCQGSAPATDRTVA